MALTVSWSRYVFGELIVCPWLSFSNVDEKFLLTIWLNGAKNFTQQVGTAAEVS